MLSFIQRIRPEWDNLGTSALTNIHKFTLHSSTDGRWVKMFRHSLSMQCPHTGDEYIYICIYIIVYVYIYNCICIRNGGIQSNSGYPSIAVARGHNVSKQYGLDVVMSWIELRGTTVESLPSPVYYKILGLLDTQQITNPFQGFKCLGIIGRETKPQPHQR